jgi:hypothetical protein
MKLLPHIARKAGILAVLTLTACSQTNEIRDLEGRRIGENAWQLIHADEARMTLAHDDVAVLVREKAVLPSRYLERWTIEGGHLFYEALETGGFASDSSGPAHLLRLYGNDAVLRSRGVDFRRPSVRSRANLAYAVVRNEDYVCFVFVSVFGDVRFPDSPGSELVRGGVCRDGSRNSVPDFEREIFGVIGALQVGGERLFELNP